ncbi:response regulator [Flavobacterium frigoris]|uniref:CheY chemotaxis protein or a CheY-like REC (Receiver) domain n=1 Tax=Flavobacterium frigoris TaxID=229204 RepID=A0A1H9JWL6_FLAFI|nr:response regulator [Flavobacterium frigoris]SEQ91192.1 CheY chemotaxis protein or a CheY-like REC (receiver) domain [Flavobacterium frigoris]
MINSNILVVDNCKVDVENAKKAFSILGLKDTLYFAENDLEAWDKLQGNQKISPIPKILLIDINQEGIKGIDLLLKIRKHEDLKSILIFVITGTDNEKNKSDALNLNIAGYLHKPIQSDKSFDFFSILYNYWNIIEYSSEKK